MCATRTADKTVKTQSRKRARLRATPEGWLREGGLEQNGGQGTRRESSQKKRRLPSDSLSGGIADSTNPVSQYGAFRVLKRIWVLLASHFTCEEATDFPAAVSKPTGMPPGSTFFEIYFSSRNARRANRAIKAHRAAPDMPGR